MKSIHVLPFVLTLMAGDALAFEFRGYMRSGLGFSEGGTDQQCFQVPGAPEKFRLGNECDTYIEASFVQDMAPRANDQSPTWRGHLTLALASSGHRDWESTTPDSKTLPDGSFEVSADFTAALREAFVSAGGVVSPESSLWMGKRFYRRKDIHMLDFYYFDNSGPGFGLENYQAGPGFLHLALTHHIPTDAGPAQKNFDVRYSGIPVGGGFLEVAGLFAHAGKADSQTGEDLYESLTGTSLHLFLENTFTPELKNFLVFQYGQGLYGASGALGGSMIDQRGGFGSQNIAKGNDDLLSQRKGSKTFRVIEMLRAENVAANFSFDSVLMYQTIDFNGEKGANSEAIPDKNELTVGIRPILAFSPQFALVSEVGYQKVENGIFDTTDNSYETSQLTKFTLAPTVSPSVGIWVRPALRFFVTYAQWNDASKGRVLRGAGRGDETAGLSAGTQVEAWW